MMSLSFTLFLFTGIFAAIGAIRGWAKELLVTMSLVVALSAISLLRQYVPQVKELGDGSVEYFYVRAGIMLVLTFFGYQTVRISQLQGRVNRTGAQDSLLGLILGGVNGYMLIGSLWSFIADAGYPFPLFISAPSASTAMGEAALWWVKYLPPTLAFLQVPWLYFIIIACFVLLFVVII